ncbi:MAG TPA: metal ABC transporter substrate-binding protein [Longimicrobiales bacterium]
MNRHATLAALLVALLPAASRAAAPAADDPGRDAPREPVRVVATLPVYAAIAKEVGGAEVEVSAIADPSEDAHFVRPKPSFALQIRRADLFITTGLDLELWVPALLDKAGNADVSEGGPGYVTAYTGIELLDVPASVDRSGGDVHIYGNPHVFTDPLNAIQIARNIATGLKRVAPERAAVWDAGVARFTDRIHRRLFGDRLVELLTGETLERLARAGNLIPFLEKTPYSGTLLIEHLGGWLREAAPFRGKKAICYHKNWAYFEDRFQLECAGYVEAKPGIPPTPGHVAALIDMMKNQGMHVLVAANYFDRAKVDAVANRAGATAVVVTLQPGGAAGVVSYFDLVDHWVGSIAHAFEQTTS